MRAATASPPLASRAHHRVREEARARANTRRVKRLRVALPVLSAVMVAGLAAAAIIPKLIPLSAFAGLSLTAEGLVMNTPRLAGSLGEGRRYEVTAERAVQSLLSPSNLSLDGLIASLDLGTSDITIEGTRAAYNTRTEILELSRGVSVASSDGNRARLEAATVNLQEGRLVSDGGVTISSPRGTLSADRLSVSGGGSVIRLSGGVKIRIEALTGPSSPGDP